jgi:hypothetical protein
MGKRERRQLAVCLGDERIRVVAWEKGSTRGGGGKIEHDTVRRQPTMGWHGRSRKRWG